MKTLEQIKQEVALMNGYEDWNEMIFASRHPNLLDDMLDDIYNAISKYYAKEVAKQALKNASIYFGSEWNKGVILNENNIPEI